MQGQLVVSTKAGTIRRSRGFRGEPMNEEKRFNQFDGWPAENSKVTVQRVTEARARELVLGKVLVDERETSVNGYDPREYRNLTTGESVWIGGDFSGWEE
jgi:hypothetical protein